MLAFLIDALPWLALATVLGYLIGALVSRHHCEVLRDEVDECRTEAARREAEIDQLARSLGDARARSADFARHADRLGAQYLALQAGQTIQRV